MDILPNEPDLILYNARVYTVDAQRPWARAVAIRKHRILAVGDDELDLRMLVGLELHFLVLDLAPRVFPGGV